MKNFLMIRTRQRFIIGFSFVFLSIAAFMLISYSGQKGLGNLVDETKMYSKIAYEFQDLRANTNRLTILYTQKMYGLHSKTSDQIAEDIQNKIKEIRTRITDINKLIKNTNIDKALLKEVSSDIESYIIGYAEIINNAKSGKKDVAEEIYRENQNTIYEKIRSKTITLEKQCNDELAQHEADSAAKEKIVDIRSIIIGGVVILLILALAIGALYLLRKIAEEIKSGVDILGTSSSDILSTITQISAGAAETATAVSETTTTIEEVRQTAMISNQKAQNLMQSSQKASDSAEKGRVSVRKVIEAMNEINRQMQAISVTVAKLSEQNRIIGEITATVADIADQSNLLAVNAAIEAAKAGEQGRGFTILAQEIRSLADQSKKATIQVKEIINEVNKSASEAVGVTEMGSKTVSASLELVNQSGEVIDFLSDNVEETAEAAIQISSSTRQQMAGMDQIVPAMENIKKASEQNSEGIKITQNSVQNIHLLGKTLKNIIIKYYL